MGISLSLYDIRNVNINTISASSSLSSRTFSSCCSNLLSRRIQVLFLRVSACLITLSGVTLVGLAIGHFVTNPFALGVSIPLLIFSVVICASSCRIKDYTNPKTILAFRNEAEHMDFDSIIDKHGLKNMFTYGVPLPQTFEKLYQKKADGLAVVSLVHFYEKISAEYQSFANPDYVYNIPPPQKWSGRWREETKDLTCEQIVNQYPLAKLQKYLLIAQQEYDVLSQLEQSYHKIRQEHLIECKRIQEAFVRAITQAKNDLEADKVRADLLYKNCLEHRNIQEIERQYQNLKLKAEREKNQKIAEAETSYLQILNMLTNEGKMKYADLNIEEKERYKQAKSRLDAVKFEVTQEAKAKQDFAHKDYIDKRKQYAADISRAEWERSRMISSACKQFEETTIPQKIERDRSFEESRARLEREIKKINETYRNFRRVAAT